MKTLVGRIQLKGFAPFFHLILLLTVQFLLSACLNEGSGSEGGTQVVVDPAEEEVLPPLTTPERTVCDPFNSGSSASDRGLVGHLLYLTDEQPRYSSASDLIENGNPIQSTLYFDRLYVPTRAFDLGFYTQEGVLVTNHNDDPIYEYFGLRLESQLALGAGEEEGWYQMAILSDDGAILNERNGDGSLSNIVDNDGTHPTRMGCGSEAIYMDADTRRNIILEYHQGPRYHIALTVLWRKLDLGEDPQNPNMDIECGRQGNSRYFDSTQVPSEPSEIYYDMLTRGWRVLTNENFYFPVQASNPCALEDPLLLTNFALNGTTRTSVTVSWTTSQPASTQAEVKDVVTGVIISSPLDSTLKTSHSVTITGLSSNTLYSVKGISEAESGQRVESSESAFRTAR